MFHPYYKVKYGNLKKKGLGITNIKHFNETFIVKWKWCLITQDIRIWRQIIISKYVEDK